MATIEETLGARLARENDEFFDRLILITSSALFVTAVVMGALFFYFEPTLRLVLAASTVGVGTVATLVLVRLEKREPARWVLLSSNLAAVLPLLLLAYMDPLWITAVLHTSLVMVLAGFLLGARPALASGVVSALAVAGSTLIRLAARPPVHSDELLGGALITVLVSITTVVVFLLVTKQARDVAALKQRLEDIDEVVEKARKIARGDLRGEIEGDSGLSLVVAEMLAGLRGLVSEIGETTSRLSSATSEIAAMSRQQEQGSLEQSAAVVEAKQTLEAMLAFATQIAESVRGVTANAESTLQNTQQIGEHVESLSGHVRRIGEILEMIKDIANKSELLALNAALEGARAGEAGRGFSLVANQMQRLTESVMESVARIRQLTADIAESTSASATATATTTSLASETAQVARRIAIITQNQASSATQVSVAMDDIAHVTEQATAGAMQTQHATTELTGLAERLAKAVDAFELE